MPLNEKGRKIKRAMAKQYGKKKGAQVFYASQNKGTVTGTERRTAKSKKSKVRGNQRTA